MVSASAYQVTQELVVQGHRWVMKQYCSKQLREIDKLPWLSNTLLSCSRQREVIHGAMVGNCNSVKIWIYSWNASPVDSHFKFAILSHTLPSSLMAKRDICLSLETCDRHDDAELYQDQCIIHLVITVSTTTAIEDSLSTLT